MSEVKIGKFRIRNLIAFFSEDEAGAFASASLPGNIGAQITSRFRIPLDYSGERIIFEPNATFADGFDRAFGGFTLQADGPDYKTFRIIAVLENSPASEAGLQKNDVITEIDGRPTAHLTITKLNEMFERSVSYKLTVRRGLQRAFLNVWRGLSHTRNAGEDLTLPELAQWAREYHALASEYVNKLTEPALDQPLAVPWAGFLTKSLGREPSVPSLGETVFQVAAHSTYHRGQINARLRELGAEPPLTDFIAWIWFGKPSAEW